MVPKPLGAPPKYNVARPDHSEFNVSSENMGDGMKMDLANAQHRQQIANTEGKHAQKQQHKHEDALHSMQMDQMKADQKFANDMRSKTGDMMIKAQEAEMDGEIAQMKQAALNASMEGLGLVPEPMTPPPQIGMAEGGWTHNAGVGGYADGIALPTDPAGQAELIRNLQNAGMSMADIQQYIAPQINRAQQAAQASQVVQPPIPDAAAPPPAEVDPARMSALGGALQDVNQIATANAHRVNATRDIARQAFGAEEEARAWQSGIDNLQGRADGGMIDRDIIVDGEFMSSHVPHIQGFQEGGNWWSSIPGAQAVYDFGASLAEPAPEVDPSQVIGWEEDQARMAANQAVQERAAKQRVEQAQAASQQAITANQMQEEELAKVVNSPTATPQERLAANEEIGNLERANQDNAANFARVAEEEGASEEAQAGIADLMNKQTPSKVNPEADASASADATAQVTKKKEEDPGWWSETLKNVGNWLGKNVINKDELITAAVVYGANQLLGYDHETGLQQGARFALGNRQARQKNEQAIKVAEIKAAEQATKDARTLKKEQATAWNQFKEKGASDIGEVFNQILPQVEGQDGPRIDATPDQISLQARDYYKQRIGNINDPEALAQIQQSQLNGARLMAQYKAANPDKKVQSIVPFLKQAEVTSLAPEISPQAFQLNPGEKDYKKVKMADPRFIAQLRDSLPGADSAQRTASLQRLWKKYQQLSKSQLARIKPREGQTHFLAFVESIL